MQFQTPEGDKVEKTLAELSRAPAGFAIGRGHLHVDNADVRPDLTSVLQASEKVAGLIRIAIVSYYNLAFLPILILGVIAFAAVTLLRWRWVLFNLCYVMALTSWMLVGLRAGLLILIDVTSFSALHAFYLAPAHFFLVSAAVFSCAAWLQLVRGTPFSQEEARTA